MPLHPLGRDYRQTLREDRAAILLADELGFAEAFVGEHVTDLAETVTSALTFVASLAYETRQIRLGTGTINLPNSHPAAVAARWQSERSQVSSSVAVCKRMVAPATAVFLVAVAAGEFCCTVWSA